MILALAFCARCRSHLVELAGRGEPPDASTLRCGACGFTATIDGFTLGRAEVLEDDPYAGAAGEVLRLAARAVTEAVGAEEGGHASDNVLSRAELTDLVEEDVAEIEQLLASLRGTAKALRTGRLA